MVREVDKTHEQETAQNIWQINYHLSIQGIVAMGGFLFACARGEWT
jgi:hypothetical protein